MFKVKIFGDNPEGKGVLQKEYPIKARDEDEARAWAVKQANELGIVGSTVIQVDRL